MFCFSKFLFDQLNLFFKWDRVVGEQACHWQDSNPGLKTLNSGKSKTATSQVATSWAAEFHTSCRHQFYFKEGYNTKQSSHRCWSSSVINAHMVTASLVWGEDKKSFVQSLPTCRGSLTYGKKSMVMRSVKAPNHMLW